MDSSYAALCRTDGLILRTKSHHHEWFLPRGLAPGSCIVLKDLLSYYSRARATSGRTKIPINMTRKFSTIILLAACSIAVGCSSARVFQTSGNDVTVGAISDVQVMLKPGALDADAETDYRSNSISGSIRSALRAELSRRGKIADHGAVVEFTVTDFRLRSGSAVFWIGVMAGPDRLAGTVSVKSGNVVLKTFEASAKGNESLWSGIATGRVSAGSRADVFCRMIARDIANQL